MSDMDWIHLAQDGVQWRGSCNFVNTVIKLRICTRAENL
jgi:hypothetical protein